MQSKDSPSRNTQAKTEDLSRRQSIVKRTQSFKQYKQRWHTWLHYVTKHMISKRFFISYFLFQSVCVWGGEIVLSICEKIKVFFILTLPKLQGST